MISISRKPPPVSKHRRFWGNYFLFENGDDFAIFDPVALKTVYASREELAPLLMSPNQSTPSSQKLVELLSAEGFSDNPVGSLKERLFNRVKQSDRLIIPKRFSGLRVVLTRKCNMSCSYCFVDTNDGSADISTKELRDGLEFLFEESAGQSEVWIQWFGGEPTIRFDLIELGDVIIRELQGKYCVGNVIKTMVTNGLNVTDAQLTYLEKEKYGVGISMDGIPGLNDKARTMLNGASGDEKVIRNIKRYRSKDIRLGINFTPTYDNVIEFPNFVDYCIDKLGVNFIYVNFPIPVNGFWPLSGIELSNSLFEGRRRAALKGGEVYSGVDRAISSVNSRLLAVFDHIESIDGLIGALLPNSRISLSEINFESSEFVFPLATVKNNRSVLGNVVKQLVPSAKCDSCPAIGVCGGPQRNDVLLIGTSEPDEEFCAFCVKTLESALWIESEI